MGRRDVPAGAAGLELLVKTGIGCRARVDLAGYLGGPPILEIIVGDGLVIMLIPGAAVDGGGLTSADLEFADELVRACEAYREALTDA